MDKVHLFWNQHFTHAQEEDWFTDYATLAEGLQVFLNKDSREILVTGVGNSPFCHELQEEYPQHVVTAIDISEVVIEQMKNKYSQDKTRFMVADVCQLGKYFEKNKFDLVIDKGCADTLMFRTHGRHQAELCLTKMWESLKHVLKSSGCFLQITLRKKPPFCNFKNWKIKTQVVMNEKVRDFSKHEKKLLMHSCFPLDDEEDYLNQIERLCKTRFDLFQLAVREMWPLLPIHFINEIATYSKACKQLTLPLVTVVDSMPVLTVPDFISNYKYLETEFKPNCYMENSVSLVGIVLNKIIFSKKFIFLELIPLLPLSELDNLITVYDLQELKKITPDLSCESDSKITEFNSDWSRYSNPEYVASLPCTQIICECESESKNDDHGSINCVKIPKNKFDIVKVCKPNDILMCVGAPGISKASILSLRAHSIYLLCPFVRAKHTGLFRAEQELYF